VAGPPPVVRVFAGRPEHSGQVRAWVRALTAVACPAAADDAELAVAELAANAIAHTRSGREGRTFTVAVAAGPDGVTIHVHDLGIGDGRVPGPRRAADDGDHLAEGGRGLPIVIAVSAACGTRPAARCPAREPGGPAAQAGGCCAWCRLDAEPQHQEEDRSAPPAQTPASGGGQGYGRHGSPARSIQWTA
jgi:serine/threonine-protein kinase RsbW